MVSCKRAAAFVVFLNIQLLVMLKSMGDQPVRVLPVVITQLTVTIKASLSRVVEYYRSVSLILSSGISK